MRVETDSLIAWGALTKRVKKGEFLFRENDTPLFYYQLVTGTVKVFNTNDNGKEFTQGEFKKGESFGEPPLFIDESYPASAVAVEDSIVLKLRKARFLELVEAHPAIQKKLLVLFARRIYNKATTAREIVNNSPESRILAFLQAYKKKNHPAGGKTTVPYTRQEIADFTGLRVETVIRTLKKMQTKNLIKIINRKLII